MTITHLYIKTHRVTGLKYFGKTVKDPFTYKGSGSYWTRHLQKHGNDVETEVYFSSDDVLSLMEKAALFSKEHDIVNSKDWANLSPETGIDGGSIPSEDGIKRIIAARQNTTFSDEWCNNISKSKIGIPCSDNTKAKISETMKGKPSNRKGKINSVEHREKISKANTGSKWWNDGNTMIRQKEYPGDGWVRGMLK